MQAPGKTNYVKIAAIVTAYFIVSITLVFSNKFLMSKEHSIPAPLFVTWFQCVLTAVIVYVLGTLGSSSPAGSWMKEFPAQVYDTKVAMKVLPLSLIFVGMVTFNNLCLQYVEVSFYNVARSLTIVCNVIFTYIFLRTWTSNLTMACLAVVICGFFVGADGEVNFSLVGTVFGVTSSVFVSLNSIYTKKTMGHVQNDKWILAYYNNVNASIIFIPLMFIFGEHNIILAFWDVLFSAYFWLMMMIAGVLGFLIGIVTVMQIDATSPLTHNISGTAKACVQTILALYIYGNETTVKAMAGVFMVVFGSAAYAYVRMKEDQEAQAAKAKQPAPGPSAGSYRPVAQAEPVELRPAGGGAGGASGQPPVVSAADEEEV